MQKSIIAVSLLAALSALPTIASAQTAAPAAAPASPWTFAGNLGLSTEYVYRGIGQSNRKPAVSGGFDLSHSSGFYVGNWNSSISWLADQSSFFPGTSGVSSNIEMDLYGGYKGEITKDLTYDIGYLYYYYPGSYPSGFVSPNTGELYGALTYGPATLKYSTSTTNLFGYTDSKNSGYLDLTGNFTISEGLTASAHIGHQTVKGTYAVSPSYTDYRVSVSQDVSGYSLTAAIVGTNAKGSAGEPYYNAFNKDLGKGRLVLSVSKSF